MTKLLASIVLSSGLALSLVGCASAPKPMGGGEAGGGGAPAASFGDTMADAPLHHLGATLKAPAGCSTSSYAKFDFPVGQAVKMDVAVEGAPGSCLSVHYLNANGGAVDGMMKELCIDKGGSETWDVEGLEGGSFVQLSEQPPCKGAAVSISVN